MRCLGIDPGLGVTGYGIIDAEAGALAFVDAGIVRTSSRAPLAERLRRIDLELEEKIRRHEPGEAAIEEVFHAKNTRSALLLGHARAAAILCAARNGLAVREYSPTEVKKAVVGTGKATKEQVQYMVRILLKIDVDLPLDASDALAVAICHSNRVKFDDLIRAGQGNVPG